MQKFFDSEKKISLFAKLALLLATIIWGSSFFILKNTLDDTPMCFLLMCRFFSAALLLSAVFYKKWKLFNVKYLWQGGITGITLALAYIFQTVGLKNTTPGVNAFLTAVYCVIVPFMMWAVTRKRPDCYNIIAAVICIAGIGLVSIEGGFTFNFMGDGMTLISGILFAAQIVEISVWGRGKDAILFTVIQFIAAGLVMLIGFLAFEDAPQNVSSGSILSIVYLAVFATTVAMLCQTVGIKHTSASSAALILSLEAVFGVVFSLLFYKERITLQMGIGFLLIFIAIIFSETKLSFLRRKK